MPKLARHPMAIAWERWKQSKEGRDALHGEARGQYLENRLAGAFKAGADAAKKAMVEGYEKPVMTERKAEHEQPRIAREPVSFTKEM